MGISFRYGIIALGVVGVLLGLLTARFWNQPLPASVAERLLPDMTFRDYAGRDVKFLDFRGKPLIINSWAAWCPFCVKEMPDFAKLQEEFGDTIAVILIDRAEPLATAKKFSDDVGVTGRLILLLDPTDSFYQSIGGFSMPETIFVNSEGMIVDHKRGPMELDEMRSRVKNVFQL